MMDSTRAPRDGDGTPRAAEANLPAATVELYRTLLDPSPTPSWINDSGKIAYANPACLRLLGASENQVIGRSPLDLIHPDDHQKVMRRIEAIHATGRPAPITEERIVRIDGTFVDVEITAWPVPFYDRKALQVSLVDISDRKQSVTSLEREHEHLRNVLDSLFTFVGVMTPDGTLIEANRAPLEAAGITAEDVLGKPFPDTYWFNHSPETRNQLREAIEKARQGISSRYDTVVRMKGDSRMVIDFMIAPMRDAEGNITFLIPSAVDVTERRRTEDELRRSEERLRATFENAAVGIAHLDPEGRWTRLNRRFYQIVGYTEEELAGRTFQAITHPDDLQADLDLAAELARGAIDSYTLEKRYVRKDGTHIWVNLTASAVRDSAGSVLYYIAVVEDISARKAAEEALSRSEAQFQALTNSVPQLVWMANPDGYITWYNRRWYEYTGTTPEQMEGWGWQCVHDPEQLPKVIERWKHSLAAVEPFDMVFPLRGADGVFRPFLTRVVPVCDEHGSVVRWFGTNTDISEQRATEDALRAANRELEQFAFVAAHDLQEPLRTIHIYSQLLTRHCVTESNSDAHQFAEYLQNAVRRMESLIRDLLGYSRILHNEAKPERSRVSLDAVLDDVLSILAEQITSEGARIQVDPLPSVIGDRTQLVLVFQNLVSNALKYRKRDQPARIHVSATTAGTEYIITVADEGLGFDQLYAERIFGLFKRLHTSEYPGTGLGLAICKRLVESQGGRIWAEGEPGIGARFHVALPAPPEELEA